jgi:hypothetical protein
LRYFLQSVKSPLFCATDNKRPGIGRFLYLERNNHQITRARGVAKGPSDMPPRPQRSPRRQDDQKSLIARLDANKWMICIVFGGLFNTGIMYQKFDQVMKNQEESARDQKSANGKITEMREKQIVGLQDIQTLKTNVQAIDNRVLVIERVFIEQPKRSK